MNDSTYDLSNAHWKTYVGRALRRKCPRCGEGALFASRFKLERECSACSLTYRREQGAMTGQLYLAAVISQVFAAVMIGAVFIFTDWSPLASIGFGCVVLLIFAFFMAPRSSALWVAIEFMTDVGNREDSVMSKATAKSASPERSGS